MLDSKPVLSGYGVQLSVKSTEYKAMDDSQVKSDSSRVAGQKDGTDEVEGFLFDILKSVSLCVCVFVLVCVYISYHITLCVVHAILHWRKS